MKIAVVGCAHGELENIYDTITCLETRRNIKFDLLICCGDFQTSRNEQDLRSMAVPPKYYNICSFYKYYSGEKLAPILTVLIGGNHEASNYLQELPYGGWVAPKMYYLGYAGVISIAGIRIAGLSGIYKSQDYMKGHFEISPFDESTKRSVYHVRNLEVFRLKQLTLPLDIFLSHDWPTNITEYGNEEQLIRFKPHFKKDIEANELGSKPSEELLKTLMPKYWFSAHLHSKFAALIPHEDDTCTKFLALDKCLPKRRFLQVLDIPHDENEEIKIKYDLEWLTILVLTNHLLSVKPVANYMPGPHGNERYSFTPSDHEKNLVLSKLNNDLTVPENFEKTAEPYNPLSNKIQYSKQSEPFKNTQNVKLCELLDIDDPIELLLKKNGKSFSQANLIFQSSTSSLSISTNDSNLEDTSDEQSFIDDTIIEENVSKVSEQKISMTRLSLSLPQPKNDSENIFFIQTDPWDDTDRNSSKRSLTNNESEVETSQVSIEDTETSENKTEDLVNRKKIKRRNIDMYIDNKD